MHSHSNVTVYRQRLDDGGDDDGDNDDGSLWVMVVMVALTLCGDGSGGHDSSVGGTFDRLRVLSGARVLGETNETPNGVLEQGLI